MDRGWTALWPEMRRGHKKLRGINMLNIGKKTARWFHYHFRGLKRKCSSLEWPCWFASENPLKHWSCLSWINSKNRTGRKDLLLLNGKKQWDCLSFPRTTWKQAASAHLAVQVDNTLESPEEAQKKPLSFWDSLLRNISFLTGHLTLFYIKWLHILQCSGAQTPASASFNG